MEATLTTKDRGVHALVVLCPRNHPLVQVFRRDGGIVYRVYRLIPRDVADAMAADDGREGSGFRDAREDARVYNEYRAENLVHSVTPLCRCRPSETDPWVVSVDKLVALVADLSPHVRKQAVLVGDLLVEPVVLP